MVSPEHSQTTRLLSLLTKLLKWDKDASLLLYRWYATYIPTRLPLLALEVSGHGVPWLIVPIFIFLFKTSLSAIAASLMLNFLALTLLDLAAIGILKPVFRRSRPAYNSGIGHVTIHAVDQFSFPSGHATRGGFLASFVWHTQNHHVEGMHPWLSSHTCTALAIVWAIALCASRVLLGRHHVLDVLIGFVLGMSYVYLWDPLWINVGFASSLRDALRSALFGSAQIAKSASGIQSHV